MDNLKMSFAQPFKAHRGRFPYQYPRITFFAAPSQRMAITYMRGVLTEACVAYFTQNPDVTGIGVRIAWYLQTAAIFLQSFLCPEEIVDTVLAYTFLFLGLLIAVVAEGPLMTVNAIPLTLMLLSGNCILGFLYSPHYPVPKSTAARLSHPIVAGIVLLESIAVVPFAVCLLVSLMRTGLVTECIANMDDRIITIVMIIGPLVIHLELLAANLVSRCIAYRYFRRHDWVRTHRIPSRLVTILFRIIAICLYFQTAAVVEITVAAGSIGPTLDAATIDFQWSTGQIIALFSIGPIYLPIAKRIVKITHGYWGPRMRRWYKTITCEDRRIQDSKADRTAEVYEEPALRSPAGQNIRGGCHFPEGVCGMSAGLRETTAHDSADEELAKISSITHVSSSVVMLVRTSTGPSTSNLQLVVLANRSSYEHDKRLDSMLVEKLTHNCGNRYAHQLSSGRHTLPDPSGSDCTQYSNLSLWA
ncbi:hypothetical protein NM688_g8264 [Phlebia brevispora]|uniref:Uncharacterized protein n=1 Tax=Phlebia brevispora TaxID=194682 RepID=A0ACC1RV63_9APHY|nr:hypothetical protein NM688_g8264 [Phlebia brevispora]